MGIVSLKKIAGLPEIGVERRGGNRFNDFLLMKKLRRKTFSIKLFKMAYHSK